MKFAFIFLLFLTFPCKKILAQNYRGLFIHAEYQALNYNYFQFGLGFNPKKHLVAISRKKEQYSFIGYTASFSKSLANSDWGIALQSVAYSGNYNGPIGLGIEASMKRVSNLNHFGIKPLIGLSFPIWSVMYGYNFDLFEDKSQRISQHELILGLRIRALKWR